MDKAWELDSAKDGDTRYFVIHGQLPKGINGDFGYPVCDTMNRHHCISPDEDEANAKLIAAAPELIDALEALGFMPDGYCFCYGGKRDANKPESEHFGECREARAAIRKGRP